MVKLKATDVKNIGRVQVSAKRLRELADKLQEVRGTDGNEEIDVYIVPGKDTGEVAQLAFDFSKKETAEEPKVTAEETKPEVKEEVKEPPTDKKEETEVKEEVKPEQKPEIKADPKVEEQQATVKEPDKTAAPVEPSKEETQSEVARISKDENLTQKAQEIKEKAYRKESE
jgi:hypothetical protein